MSMNSQAIKPWQISFLLHGLFVAIFLVLTNLSTHIPEMIEVPVEVSMPKEVQNLTEVKEQPKVALKSVNEAKPTQGQVREVFGTSRNSLTDESGGTIEAKKGNTLTKAQDAEILRDTDADSLPTPTEEYLVSEMPSVLSEVRPEYPREARDQKLTGLVEMDVLIDAMGEVRQVNVLKGEKNFLANAVAAMKKFKFRPAQVDGKPVAVRIRYSLEFKLEY
jgi:TonB family protein